MINVFSTATPNLYFSPLTSPPPLPNNSNNSTQRRIILLSMLTPTLRRYMLIRRNGPSLLFGTDFKNHGGNNAYPKRADCGVALPRYGSGPPSSGGGPYLQCEVLGT